MLPGYVKEALQRLDDAGHIAYVVGGSVRDFLLDRQSKDHDIATSASPDDLCRLFPDAVTVGKAFGVLKIPLPEHSTVLEIASFRKDLEYRDHRHPSGILFAGPEEDARRRDFTINALYYDSKSSRILDTVGGISDLDRKVVRAIGTPLERFKEDALRLLRAVRFAVALDFTLEEKTAEAIQQRGKLITKVSAERIRDELTLMWKGPRPFEALRMLSELGLLPHVLPEVEALRRIPPVWRNLLKVLEHLSRQSPARSTALAWASLLHDVGKPVVESRASGGGRVKAFNGYDREGARIARSICERLRLSRGDVERVVRLVEDHLKFKDVFQMREATLQRLIREPHFEELLALHKADATASDGNLAYYEFCASRLEEFKKSPAEGEAKLITGEDLIQLGFQPGPRFSEILRSVEDLAMERKLRTKEDALEYVIKHFVA